MPTQLNKSGEIMASCSNCCRHLRRQIVIGSWCLILIWHNANVVGEANDVCIAARDQSSQILTCNCTEPPTFCLRHPDEPIKDCEDEVNVTETYTVTELATIAMTSSSPSTVLETTKTITQTPAASKSGSSPGSTPSEEKTTAIHITDVATKDALPTLILQPVNPVGKDDKRVWTPVLISVVSGSFGCLALILVVLCVVYIKRKKRFSRLEESNSSKNSTSSEPNRHLPNIFTEQLHPGLTPKAMNSDAEDNSDKVLKSFGVMPDYEEDIFNRQSSMPFIPCADYDDNQAGNAVFYREARAHQNIEHQFTNPIYEPSSYNPHSTSDPRQNNERLDKHDPVYWQQRYSNRPTRNASRGSPNKFEDQLNRLQNVYGHNFDGVSKSPYHLTH